MSSRREIREKYIAIRKTLSNERRLEASLSAQCFLLKIIAPFSRILSFSSKKEEINLWSFNQQIAQEGRLLLPRIMSSSEFVPFQVNQCDRELVLHSRWKILEPDPWLCKEVSKEEIDCVLVPGLAFDSKKGRLGYGKGFYDRFLCKLSCLSIGIGFKEQWLKSPFPHQRHDILLKKIYLF